METTVHYCPGCHRELREGVKFCVGCGCTVNATGDGPEPGTPAAVATGRSFATNWKELKEIGLLFGLLLCGSLILGIVRRFDKSPLPEVILSGVDALIVVVFVVRSRRDILPLLNWPKLDRKSVITTAALSVGFISVASLYFNLLNWAGVPVTSVTNTFKVAGWHAGKMLLLVSITPAFFEELAFRGVIQSTLESVFDKREAWLLQAALFSVLHLSPIIFPSHFLMGLCFGQMRRMTNSLYPGMALHATWNALVVLQELV